MPDSPRAVCRILTSLCWGYLLLLYTWLAAYLLVGERFAYLALVDLIAVYLFFPLPLAALIAAICRRRRLWPGILLGAAVFVWLWGVQFTPARWPLFKPARASQPVLSVMTYNVLAYHHQTQPILDVVRAENPDVVFFQELNHGLAHALQDELRDLYPYQVLAPQDNARGIGTISKFPLRDSGGRLPLDWIGGPQVLFLDWEGRQITLINFHMYATTHMGSSGYVARTLSLREAEAQALVERASRADGPVILGGDANSVMLNTSYKILAAGLQDAWRQAGFGLGHTFPGSKLPGSDRPHIGSLYAPAWMARIDYIFHTPEWLALSARLAQVDGVSDHRGVVADLVLKP